MLNTCLFKQGRHFYIALVKKKFVNMLTKRFTVLQGNFAFLQKVLACLYVLKKKIWKTKCLVRQIHFFLLKAYHKNHVKKVLFSYLNAPFSSTPSRAKGNVIKEILLCTEKFWASVFNLLLSFLKTNWQR